MPTQKQTDFKWVPNIYYLVCFSNTRGEFVKYYLQTYQASDILQVKNL